MTHGATVHPTARDPGPEHMEVTQEEWVRATPRSQREWDKGDIVAVQAQDTVPETQLADEKA